jgi:hypothetical protein
VIDNSWQIRTWEREHATHGVFFVSLAAGGGYRAQRVYGSPSPRHEVEDLSPGESFANVGLAMMACEQRVAELDQAIVDQTCADLRAYATRVA